MKDNHSKSANTGSFSKLKKYIIKKLIYNLGQSILGKHVPSECVENHR